MKEHEIRDQEELNLRFAIDKQGNDSNSPIKDDDSLDKLKECWGI